MLESPTDLIQLEVIFNQALDGRNASLIVYHRFSNLFYLVNDWSTASTPVGLRQAGLAYWVAS